jgi:hypothetical protein
MGAGIGHNNGPTLEPGTSWRRHAWGRARAALLPVLPVEVVRLRVKRAAELGLPYRTYASVRASTGHDLIGFLFSSNALRMLRDEALPEDRAAALRGLVATERRVLAHLPLDVARVAALPEVDAAHRAPPFTEGWRAMRERLCAALEGRPADRFLLVGETTVERGWAEAVRAAGFVTGEAYFAGAT